MDNYMMYMGADGVYTHTVCYERDEQCLVCSPGVPVPASDDMTLQQVRVMLLPLAQTETARAFCFALPSCQLCMRLLFRRPSLNPCCTMHAPDNEWNVTHRGLQLMEELQTCGPLAEKLTSPTISSDARMLYMQGPLAAQYTANLSKKLRELLPGPISNSRSYMLNVTDPTQPHPMRVRLISKDDNKMQIE
jgi:hypothetical protein